MTSRRDFLKQSCSACVMVAGFGFLLTQESCSTPSNAMKFSASNGKINVPLSAFGDKNTLLVREASMHNDILLVRKPGEEIHALLMKCTHQGGSLHEKQGILVCPRHGSNFNLEGNVIKSPAKRPLQQFPVKIQGDDVVISV